MSAVVFSHAMVGPQLAKKGCMKSDPPQHQTIMIQRFIPLIWVCELVTC